MANFNQTGIDWEGLGYFGCPDPKPKFVVSLDKIIDPWDLWTVAFHRAKLGDFKYVPELTPIFMGSADWLLVTTCSDLIGDAGIGTCFDSLLVSLKETKDFPRVREICRALYLRGKLSDIPTILDAYDNFSSFKDADIIPVWISDLLETEDGALAEPAHFKDPEDYYEAVLKSYKQLADEMGSDQVYVFRRKRFGVVSLAKHILGRVRKPFVRSILRQKFEASTGIDCTKFYKREELRPLAAAAIVEDFLESPEAEKYEDGVRYFFGHRIPD